MKKTTEKFKILKSIVIVFLVAVLLFNLIIMIKAKLKPNSVPSIFGYKPFIVLSGSMESEISVGDLVFVKEVDTDTLNVNDVIAFRDSNNLVTTHRIVKFVSTDNGTCYVTKGDNNNTTDDEIVCPKSVEGKYVSKISKVGNAILFIQKPLGFTIMMLIIVIVCILIYVFNNKNNNKLSNEELKEFEEYKKKKQQESAE